MLYQIKIFLRVKFSKDDVDFVRPGGNSLNFSVLTESILAGHQIRKEHFQ